MAAGLEDTAVTGQRSWEAAGPVHCNQANGSQSCDADLQHLGKETVMPKVAFHTDLKKTPEAAHGVEDVDAGYDCAGRAFVRATHAAGKLSFWRLGPLGTFQRLNTGQWNSQHLNPRNIG
jgi:hypothetical protein